MNNTFRLSALMVFAALLAAPVAEAHHKRNWHMGDRVPLKRGMRGHDVKVLQDFLGRAGFRTAVDGVFGRGTYRSVRRFERAQGYRVNGVAYRRDMRALRRVAAERAAGRSAAPDAERLPKATLTEDGVAVAPAEAPEAVKQIIAAGNEIATKPYKYGGGHGRWDDTGYDCSGSVSYALHGAGLLEEAMPSGGFVRWGEKGRGRWVTIYANSGHMYMEVAGLRFDTTARKQTGNRWTTERRSSRGYAVRHPEGL